MTPKFDRSLVLSKDVYWIAGTTFVVDQLTKLWVVLSIELYDRIYVLPFFNLVHTKNKGAAFGMFHDASPAFRLVFFGVMTLVSLGVILYWLGTTPRHQKWMRASIILILGGALGNVLDRIAFGQVTDFLQLHIGEEYYWPAFNIADSAICVGVGLGIILMFFESKHTKSA